MSPQITPRVFHLDGQIIIRVFLDNRGFQDIELPGTNPERLIFELAAARLEASR